MWMCVLKVCIVSYFVWELNFGVLSYCSDLRCNITKELLLIIYSLIHYTVKNEILKLSFKVVENINSVFLENSNYSCGK